ncbi:hypothetical protein FBY06_14421 [Pseudomonas sp. SJZ085]|uniref:hypothetical protein n=1 Tax=unclassified Pseudomonas TaxID=196821 RepID=UPI00119B4D9E|nr:MULTISPECIES: hypothetical protein [unclassified Pseudomonas]TWC11432.1 hypothetical protein FBX99_14421 [Pseudomonas sp. SJZ074]TWC30034.1 hypothetical protein FBY06_14421 [Pseudomonas sp. SJZ085]
MTLNVYAEVGSNFQQVGGDCPDGWIQMTGQRPDGEDTLLYTASDTGLWVISEATRQRIAAAREASWVEAEMVVIAEQLVMLEDEDPSARPGTSRQWRDYRIALRAWNEANPDFPDATKRPVQPT